MSDQRDLNVLGESLSDPVRVTSLGEVGSRELVEGVAVEGTLKVLQSQCISVCICRFKVSENNT